MSKIIVISSELEPNDNYIDSLSGSNMVYEYRYNED